MSEDVHLGSLTRLLVLRHGQSEWNVQGRWQGQADIALTQEGLRQAREAAEKLGTFDLIASSSLQRARRTAEIIAEIHGVGDVVIDDRLKESHIGPWEGLTYVEIESRWPGYLASRQQPEGFEPSHAIIQRMTEAFGDIATECRGGQALIISHSGVIRTLRRGLSVIDTRLENLGGSWFGIDNAGRVSAGRVVAVIGEVNSSESL